MGEPMAKQQDYAQRFTRLNVNRGKGSASPHKPCLLLAVIDLIDDSEHPQNRFYYAPPLLERYHRYFDAVKGESDHPNPHFPFFHLKGDGFYPAARQPRGAPVSSCRNPSPIMHRSTAAWGAMFASTRIHRQF